MNATGRRVAWLFLVGAAPLHAAGLTAARPTVLPRPAVSTAAVVAPVITGVQPSGCVHPGASVTVQGDNFGSPSGAALALHGSAGHLDLSVTSWSATQIVATLPAPAPLAAGAAYAVGIERGGHGAWVSNVDHTVTLCAPAVPMNNGPTSAALRPAATITASPPAPVAEPVPVSETPGATLAAQLPETPPATPNAAPPFTARSPIPTSGASLLQTGLPPPPHHAPPVKQDPTVEPGELVVVSANLNDAQALAAAAADLGLGIKRRTNLGGLGLVVTVLRLPKEASVGASLAALRQALPAIWADANHRYGLLSDTHAHPAEWIGWSVAPNCGQRARIGLIDTQVDGDHPMLRGGRIDARSFLPSGITPAPRAHGTAIASLLIGNGEAGLHGLVPQAQLEVAAVFRQRAGNELDATADAIVQALDWLVLQKVAVINMSFGGPRNLIIEAAVQRVLASGVVVVAAAGNGGADGPPVYPAKQEGVIAVTAVDARLQPYARASHGDYISFAAPGVEVPSAGADGIVYLSGTSYAAPFVTAAVASDGAKNGPTAVAHLRAAARDLGTPGKDPVFGWGLLQARGCAAH